MNSQADDGRVLATAGVLVNEAAGALDLEGGLEAVDGIVRRHDEVLKLEKKWLMVWSVSLNCELMRDERCPTEGIHGLL